MGGSSKPQTTTTKFEMSPEQRELYGLASPYAKQFAASPPELYPGSGVAGFTPEQQLAQELALSGAEQQGNLLGTGMDTSSFLLGDVLYPESNPALRRTIEAATRPVYEGLEERVLPAIRSEFEAAGPGVGFSREQIAEGIAGREAGRTAGDISAKISTEGYGKGLDAVTRALGLLPQTAQAINLPAATVSAVGTEKQAMNQAQLTEQVQRWLYEQNLPLEMANALVSLISGIPGGTTTTTGTAPQGSKAQKALGGAASGAALGSAIMPGIGTGVGAGLGALLGFL